MNRNEKKELNEKVTNDGFEKETKPDVLFNAEENGMHRLGNWISGSSEGDKSILSMPFFTSHVKKMESDLTFEQLDLSSQLIYNHSAFSKKNQLGSYTLQPGVRADDESEETSLISDSLTLPHLQILSSPAPPGEQFEQIY